MRLCYEMAVVSLGGQSVTQIYLQNRSWFSQAKWDIPDCITWIWSRFIRIQSLDLWIHSPLILLRLHTRITVHAQTAAGQQSNGTSGAWMSQICGEWRNVFIKTLSLSQRVLVQDQGSKIPCVTPGNIKNIASDRFHQQLIHDQKSLDCKWLTTAACAASEGLWEMEGQKLGHRSRLGERQGPWLTHLVTPSLMLCFRHCMQLVRMAHPKNFFTATAGKDCTIQDAGGGGQGRGRRAGQGAEGCEKMLASRSSLGQRMQEEEQCAAT